MVGGGGGGGVVQAAADTLDVGGNNDLDGKKSQPGY